AAPTGATAVGCPGSCRRAAGRRPLPHPPPRVPTMAPSTPRPPPPASGVWFSSGSAFSFDVREVGSAGRADPVGGRGRRCAAATTADPGAVPGAARARLLVALGVEPGRVAQRGGERGDRLGGDFGGE